MSNRFVSAVLVPVVTVASTSLIFGCGAVRDTRATTPPAPIGPVQTASDSDSLVPAGTRLIIRTNEPIQSETEGSLYDAEVAQEVVNSNYDVLIAERSPVELVVVRVDRGGVVSTPELELALQSVMIRGHRFAIDSGTNAQQEEEGLGNNERTGTMVGGGAVLGTVIGAIAGGVQGAAVGAAVGAAGGATGVVLTRGREVKIPAESLLTFRIEQPIDLGR